ncbi:MAG: hypothetical protein M1825_003627 [Sarcosagium campestre]|nr:MAG: hypothetical protein M1825_003627 [Sarcosagium campestre]
MFYNDLILSKCAREGFIVLWRIIGFSSASPPPGPDAAPTTHEQRETRSAFGAGYERLLQFACPATDPFYMRFGLFHGAGLHHVLAMGNVHSKIFFWDFAALVACAEGTDPRSLPPPHSHARKGQKGAAPRGIGRESSIASTTTAATTASSSAASIVASIGDDVSRGEAGGTAAAAAAAAAGGVGPRGLGRKLGPKYDIMDPFALIEAHKTVTVPKVSFATRQIAWSVGGEWMVVVGDHGVIALFGRDGMEESW